MTKDYSEDRERGYSRFDELRGFVDKAHPDANYRISFKYCYDWKHHVANPFHRINNKIHRGDK